SFTATLSLANNGQLLSITGITRTGITPTCPFTPAANSTTLSVNQNVTYYADTDNDGFGNAGASSVSCFGAPAGYIVDNTDCNDAVVYYQDLDADGFGSSVKINCGTVTNNTDCNDLVIYYQDNDADGFGSNVKVNCGTITNNTDCDDSQIFYEDIDGDGYGSTTMSACSNVLTSTDCNDNEASAHPGASEIGYDLIDNDCDGLVDEGFPPKQTTLMTALCGVTLPGIDTPIYANLVAGAQGYRWRITTMIGTTPGQVQFLDTALRTMRFTQLPNYAFNTNYRVEVAVYYSNHLQPYLASTCEVTTPSPTTQLVDCGATLQNMTDIIYAGIVPYAKGYRFRITDPSSQSNTQVIDRNIREFRMNLVTSFFVQYGKTYNIECALKNTDGTYLPYGAACTVTTPLFPSTSIQESQCDNGDSSPYIVPDSNTLVYADSFPGAVGYAFKLVGPGLPASGAVVVKTLRGFRLSDFAGAGLIPGASYNASVRLIFNYNDADGPYGKVCVLTVPGLSRTAHKDWTATTSPNPFADDFSVTISGKSASDVSIKVYDMTGRILEQRMVKADDTDSAKLGSSYPSGVYTIIVQQGDETTAKRIIKR
ncbi:MAG: T9SS type A sorting domain-containing protein, partial [Flavobacterium sp.]